MTPYGYRIIDGKAVLSSEEAIKLRRMIALYLSGFTIEKARQDAEIPLSSSSASRLLSNKLYLGTDFYPPIINQETFEQVQKEKKRRNRRPEGLDSRKFVPVTVKTRFRLDVMPMQGSYNSSKTLVEEIYKSIQSHMSNLPEETFSTVLDDQKNKYIQFLFQILP